MQYNTLLQTIEHGVATLAFNRPDRLNALTLGMLGELREALGQVIADDTVRVIVLTGFGRAFAAGVDLRDFEPDPDAIAKGNVGEKLNDLARDVIRMMESCGKPVIAKVNGACFTGALEIALGCDWIIASEDALFGDTHAKLGIRPTWGMSARLCEAVGVRRARELSFTGRSITGKQAEQYGLANIAVPATDLDTTVATCCAQIVDNSNNSVAAYKFLYRDSTAAPREAALDVEAQSEFDCPDALQRIETFVQGMSRK